MMKLQSVGSSLGSSLMAVGVLGLVGWIGYENYRVQQSRDYGYAQRRAEGYAAGDEALPETHELLMVEMTLPDAPELTAAPRTQLRIQFSTNEWDEVKASAQQCNMPVTRYVREKLLDGECPKRS